MAPVTRRRVLIGAGSLCAAVGAGMVTRGFGLLPEEYEASPVFAQDGVAIRGTDPVAYFTEKRPRPGQDRFSLDWSGASWRFATSENLAAFKADPTAFAPQYGGFCAWAVAAKGKLYSTQPANWSLVDGKLYLNYNDDIQARWEQDIEGFIVEGDRRWPEILKSA